MPGSSPPLLAAPPVQRSPATDVFHSSVRRPVVLVVDDEANVRELLAVGLSAYGYEVRTAVGGAHAIDVCQQDREAIVAALIDKRMPGVHGFSTLAAIRQIAPHARCWLITGDADAYAPDELEQLGAQGVIHKPFQLQEIVRLLRS